MLDFFSSIVDSVPTRKILLQIIIMSYLSNIKIIKVLRSEKYKKILQVICNKKKRRVLFL